METDREEYLDCGLYQEYAVYLLLGLFLARDLGYGFTLGWTALTDPDSFFDNLKTLAPGIDLADHIIQELRKSAADTKALIPEEWGKGHGWWGCERG